MSDEKMKDRNNRGKFDTLYNWIYNELLKMILAGQIRPHEQLPSEAEIAERFGVSRMTSKMALNALADEKIVYRVARKGSFLAEVDLNRIRNMVDCKGVVGGSVNNLNVIALIIPKLDTYCGSIVKEMVELADAHGYQILLKYTDGHADTENRILGEVANMPEVRGVVLFPSDSNHCGRELLNYKIQNYPIVILDRFYKEIEFDIVCHDHYQGAYDAVNQLIGKGHSAIGFISRSISNVSSRQDRYQGFVSAMMEHNKRIRRERVKITEESVETIVETLIEYLKENDSLTAVLCADNFLTVHLNYALQELGMSVGKDLTVVGYSDGQPANYLSKKIALIQQPVKEMCEVAFRKLMNKVDIGSEEVDVVKIRMELCGTENIAQIDA
ncbi:MAG: GntR family transcriptional regulator [Clostridia bacterium]|nr:GntR family transcriptional regulator [Clostridia bacterium]